MKRHKWKIHGVLALLAWFAMGVSLAQAQTNVILPVDASGSPIPGSPVTVSILQGGDDRTATWFPVPGEPFIVRVNGELVSTFDLVDDATTALTTSRIPGVSTNFGDPTDTSLDFTGPVAIPPNEFEFTPQDSGGSLVILVNENLTFVIPQDDDNDGIATNFEELRCPSGNCDPITDIDTGPDGLSPTRDGFANRDEYRGFRVNEQYVRGDPQVKDVFLHLEDTEQCTTTAGSFTGDGGTPVDLDFFFPTPADLDDLFTNVNTLSPAMNVHRISSDEWVDNFSYYDRLSRVQLTDAITDRWINQNAIVPLGAEDPTVPSTGRRFVKGVRVVQCLDLFQLSPLGRADKDPPDKFDSDNGTAVLFIHRIVHSFLNKISAGGTRELAYYTFESGRWNFQSSFSFPVDPSNVSDPSVQAIIKIALAWYLAHEAVEHSFDVTNTAQGTRKVSYGYHHAEGTGTNVDLKIEHKVDKKTSGQNKFYIPKFHGISDKREIRILSSQVAP
jgi:hypothetical protein